MTSRDRKSLVLFDRQLESWTYIDYRFVFLSIRRQTYKFAVIYIGPGQEDKQSILSNSRGSIEFERFVSSLGWSVNLATHHGFKGGLQYPEDGDIATYFANPTVEAIFHVATQMPSITEEDRHRMVSCGIIRIFNFTSI